MVNYGQTLSFPAIADTPLLWTGAKSPAKTTKKCIRITPAIADSRYYEIADTLCDPKRTFVLFYLVTTDTSDVLNEIFCSLSAEVR